MMPADAVLERPAEPGIGLRLRTAVGAGVALFFYSAIDSYASDAWSAPSPVLYVLATVAAAVAAVATTPERLNRVGRLPFMLWLFGYFAMTTLWAIFMKGVPAVTQTLIDRYRSMAMLLALVLLFAEPAVLRAARWAVAAGVALGSALNLAEAFGLQFAPSEERVAGRSAGFYVNANGSGLALALGAAVVIPFLPRRYRVPLLVVTTAGVAITFSRSAALELVVAALVLAAVRSVRIGRTVFAAVLVAMLFALWSGDISSYFEDTGVLNANTVSRLRLTNDDSGRIELARRAWELFLRSPIVGNGIGATADWDVGLQTHNQYLALGADYGIPGMLMWPLLAVALAFRRKGAWPAAAVLLVAGFFSHGLLFERPPLLLIALLGSTVGGAEAEREQGQAAETGPALSQRAPGA